MIMKNIILNFGIMRFGDGVIFSSRGGNVIRLVDLLDQALKMR